MLKLILPQTAIRAVKQIFAVKMDKNFSTYCRLLSSQKFTVQDSLPHLPVPPLEQTLHKYHQSVQPLLDEEELEHTSKVIAKFKTKQGPLLQKLLEERAKKHENWLSDWWKHHAYLNFRSSVVVNSNPGVLLPRQNYEGVEGQLKFAAKFISGIIDYKFLLDEKKLHPEKSGMQPLCMAQHYNILSSCRIPGIKSDSWHNFSEDYPSHITVISNNHFFSLNVYGKKRRPLSVEQVYQQLKVIYSKSEEPAPQIGILTTESRNEWGKIYKKLIKDKQNRGSLESIHQSIFVVCLDRLIPSVAADTKQTKSLMAGQMLHGGGSNSSSGNRWFDKTLQIIFGPDGMCGLNYEHTSAEGPPIITLLDHVLTYCYANEEKILPAVGIQEPVRLKFNLGAKILEAIENAKKNADSLIDDVDLTISKYTLFGKEFLKSVKLSPDAFIQVALQLAYYRLYKEPCATYESASLRRFKYGRTETIRSCTVPSYLFTCAMDDSRVPAIEKIQFLRQAVQVHKNISNDAISGQGIDRHLLGLKLIAIENGMDIPKLFMDTAYTKNMHHKLSTSQVSSKYESIMCYGPTAPDGYGVCYNPQSSKIGFAVSALDTSPETCSKKMTAAIHQSLSDMQKLALEFQVSKL